MTYNEMIKRNRVFVNFEDKTQIDWQPQAAVRNRNLSLNPKAAAAVFAVVAAFVLKDGKFPAKYDKNPAWQMSISTVIIEP